jgi:hypothetical protein
VSRPANVQLPAEALARWRALEPAPASAEPVERVVAWIARLQARMLVSSGRLGSLMIATGLCEAEVIVECLHAQLDAGPPGKRALDYDVTSDLFAVASSASLDSLERLSVRLAGLEWASALTGVDELHCDLAGRMVEQGREREAEAALARVDWHLPLIRLLEEQGAALTPRLLERLIQRAARLVASSHLPAEYHVGLFTELAVIGSDRRLLERARSLLITLTPAELEATPDHPHLVEDVAWGLASLGEFDEALASIAELPRSDRWPALIRLLPLSDDPATRAAMIDELFESVEPLEMMWAWLIEAVPEIAPRVLPRLLAIPDETLRFEELAAAARFLTHEQAELPCTWMLTHARTLAPNSPRWPKVWEDTLDALHACGRMTMLDDTARSGLIDELLARPELDLWHEVAAFVPDDRVVAVLEHSTTELGLADHYVDREAWIELGLAVIERAPSELAERWLALAADALALTGIEGASLDRLAAWTPEQRRSIVVARLRQHQLEFLPNHLIQPWLLALGWVLPPSLIARVPAVLARIPADVRARQCERTVEFTIVVAPEPIEQARCRAALDDVLALPGWPSHDRVLWVFALLGRCAGEAAMHEALAVLADASGEVESPR